MNIKELIEKYIEKSRGTNCPLNKEESVKNMIIRPMLEGVCGYDYEDGENAIGYEQEVDVGQVGSKSNHSRCDYLLKNATYKCVIEAKALTESVTETKHIKELASYVLLLKANWGILSNGRYWALFLAGDDYTMEEKPFKTIDFENTTEDEKKFLVNLLKKTGGMPLDEIRKVHAEAKKKNEQDELKAKIELAVIAERKNLCDEEIRRIIKAVEPDCKIVTQKIIDSYSGYIKEALNNIITKEKEQYKKEALSEMHKYIDKVEDEEREAYYYVLGVLADKYPDAEINLWSFPSGTGAKVCFRGQNSGQPILWICGKIENEKYKFIGCAFAKQGGTQMGDIIPMTSTKDLLAYRDRIRQEADLSAKGPRTVSSTISESASSGEPETA